MTANKWYCIAQSSTFDSSCGITIYSEGVAVSFTASVRFGSSSINIASCAIDGDILLSVRLRETDNKWCIDLLCNTEFNPTIDITDSPYWEVQNTPAGTGSILAIINDISKEFNTGIKGGESLWQLFNFGTQEKPEYAVVPKDYDGKPIGVVSKTFISFGGHNSGAGESGGTGGGGITTFDVYVGNDGPYSLVNGRVNLPAYPTANLTGYATENWVKEQGYLTQHQDISHLLGKEEAKDIYATIIALNEVSDRVETIESIIGIDSKGNVYIKKKADGTARDFYTYGAISFGGNGQSSGSGEVIGSSVQYNASVTSGKLLGTLVIDGVDNKIYAPAIPTKVSAFTNDEGYVTEDWVNNQGFLTAHQSLTHLLSKEEAADTYQPKGDYVVLDDLSSYLLASTAKNTYATIQALNGVTTRINTLETTLSTEQGYIDTLQGYFTSGKANKAIADGNGNNIVDTYATKAALKDVADKVTTLQDMWFFDEAHANTIRTLYNVVVDKAISFGGYGESSGSGGGITTVTKQMVLDALGYTPYNAANPNGYITSSALNGYATQTWVENQGYLTNTSLSSYVDLASAQDITGIKTFVNGVKIGSTLFSEKTNNNTKYVELDGNLVVKGSISFGSVGESNSGGNGGITVVTKDMVLEALGYTPYDASNPKGYITSAYIPTSLKNPYGLTITAGSTTVKYDGSTTKSITITAASLGALTEHQDISHLLSKEEAESTYQLAGDYITIQEFNSELNNRNYITAGSVSDTYATKAQLNNTNNNLLDLQDAHDTLRSEFDALDDLLNSDVSGKINTWREVVNFLDEYSGSQDLATILSGINADIDNRALQSDLDKTNTNLSNHIKDFNSYKTATDKRLDSLESLWYLDDENSAVRTKLNVIIEKAISFGGAGESSGNGGGITTVTKDMVIDALGYTPYSATNPNGYITSSAIPTSLKNPYSLTINNSAGTAQVSYDGSTTKSLTLTKAMVGLGNVENTALSAWTGSSKITTLGTITSGTWNGTKIANSYLANSSITISGTSVSLGGSITQASLRTALGLGSLAYKNSLVASDIPNLDWSKITGGKPTTLSGYGITDAYTKTAADSAFLGINTLGIDADGVTNLNKVGYGYATGGWYGSGPALAFGSTNGYTALIQQGTSTHTLYVSYKSNGGSIKSWKEIAFTDSDITGNAASATKLQTSRTLWGQSFDGSKNVTGSLFYVLNINPDTAHDYSCGASDKPWKVVYTRYIDTYTGYDLRFRTGGTEQMRITATSGCLILGGSSAAENSNYKLDVRGIGRFINNSDNSGVVIGNKGNTIDGYYNGWGNLYLNYTSSGNVNLAYGGGNVGIGTTAPSSKLHVAGNIYTTGNVTADGDIVTDSDVYGDYFLIKNRSSNPYYKLTDGSYSGYVQLLTDGSMALGSTSYYSLTVGQTGLVTVNGNLVATGSITFGSASDRRLKDNIKSMTDKQAVAVLSALNPVTFKWNSTAYELGKLSGVSDGFIADEYERLIPNSGRDIWANYRAINYERATGYLVKGWQNHETRLEKAERRIKELENELKYRRA